MDDRLKVLRSTAASVAAHPLVPAELRRACVELVELVSELRASSANCQARLEALERGRWGQ